MTNHDDTDTDTDTGTEPTIDRSKIRAAIVEAALASCNAKGWHCVRVYDDGDILVECREQAETDQDRQLNPGMGGVLIWETTSDGPDPGAGIFDWEDADMDHAEFFTRPGATWADHGSDWCWPDEREEYPLCTEPTQLGDLTDYGVVDDAEEQAVAQLSDLGWDVTD